MKGKSEGKSNYKKGRRRSSSGSFSGRRQSGDSKSSSILVNGGSLPSPTVLQEYEYATEGAADRIIAMAESEQTRRAEWEQSYFDFFKRSVRLGQLFGFLMIAFVIAETVYLSVNGKEQIAILLSAFAFGGMALSSLFSTFGGRYNPRKKKNF